MPKKFCIVCGAVTDQTRCPKHRTNKARGYGAEHTAQRRIAIAMRPYCWKCGCPITTCKLELHHVEPMYGGRSDEIDDRRMLLCRKCHREITNAQ